MAVTETVPPPARARRPGRRLAVVADVVVLIGIAALVAFPVGARIAADRLPRAAPPLLAPLPAGLPHPPLQDLPGGLKPGSVDVAAAALLGELRGRRLMRMVRTGTTGRDGLGNPPFRYPYRYPWLERI